MSSDDATVIPFPRRTDGRDAAAAALLGAIREVRREDEPDDDLLALEDELTRVWRELEEVKAERDWLRGLVDKLADRR